jgi:hypothetical protein
MPSYAVGNIVVVPFPFSGAPEEVNRRPAVVVATWPVTAGRTQTQDYLLALITSQVTADPHRIAITPGDVIGRQLTAVQSFVRPTYLFAADEELIAYKMASLYPQALDKVLLTLHQLFAPVGTPSVESLQAQIEALGQEVANLKQHLQGSNADVTDDGPQETG